MEILINIISTLLIELYELLAIGIQQVTGTGRYHVA